MSFEAEGGPVGIIGIRSYKIRRPRITPYFKAVISAYNSNIKLLEEIRDKTKRSWNSVFDKNGIKRRRD